MSGLIVFAVMPAGRVDPAVLTLGDGLPGGMKILSAGALAAVVGPVPEGGLKGRDRSMLLPWLLAREKMMERLLALTPVLPVSLGTELEDEARVRHLLDRGEDVLQDALGTLGARVEMNLTVRWALDAVVARLLGGMSPALRAAAERGDAAARQALGVQLGTLVASERQEVRRRVVEHLAPAVSDLIVTEPAAQEDVAGFALLLDREAEAGLDAALEALDLAFAGALSFRLVGPLAPYSFASVDVHLSPLDAVQAARSELGVAADIDPKTLKEVYRKALRQVHPDLVALRSQSGLEADSDEENGPSEGFLAVSAAYRILEAEDAPVSVRRQDGLSIG